MGKKLTEAQRRVLAMCTDEPNLRNGDEAERSWWIEGHGAVNKRVAESLRKAGLVEFCAKWGGDPGILGYRITPAGRSALAEEERG